ncbi:MAG: HypC/HybG/HupF family hydrogenase formation chaperone [Solirubrobacterales bacterium]
MCLAIPGQITEILDPELRLARAEIAGVSREVNVGLLDSEGPGAVAVGDWVLIHVGFAMSKIDEVQARETLELLSGLGAPFDEELGQIRGSAEP